MSDETTIAEPVSQGKFLVCVDKNEESKAALRFACMKAKASNASVVMLHIIEPMADVQSLFSVADKMREERQEEAQTLLKEFTALANECGEAQAEPIIREGRIGETILQVVLEDADINMVVLGATPASAGRGRLITWVASQLGDKLLVPLMLVPGMLTEQQMQALV